MGVGGRARVFLRAIQSFGREGSDAGGLQKRRRLAALCTINGAWAQVTVLSK